MHPRAVTAVGGGMAAGLTPRSARDHGERHDASLLGTLLVSLRWFFLSSERGAGRSLGARRGKGGVERPEPSLLGSPKYLWAFPSKSSNLKQLTSGRILRGWGSRSWSHDRRSVMHTASSPVMDAGARSTRPPSVHLPQHTEPAPPPMTPTPGGLVSRLSLRTPIPGSVRRKVGDGTSGTLTVCGLKREPRGFRTPS